MEPIGSLRIKDTSSRFNVNSLTLTSEVSLRLAVL